MQDDRKISICIPTYNRTNMLFEAFEKVYDDERISEIVIVDDVSEPSVFEEIQTVCNGLSKVVLKRNITNQDCYRNKMIALDYATNEWAILLDSDNIIDTDYIDKIFSIKQWDRKTFYTPSFAAPHFDFRNYEGVTLTRQNVYQYIDKPMLETCLNAANFFVCAEEYLKVWNPNIDPVTSDSIFMCHNFLKDGGSVYIVPGLTYQHRVHEGSHYKNNVHRTEKGFHELIVTKIRNLR